MKQEFAALFRFFAPMLVLWLLSCGHSGSQGPMSITVSFSPEPLRVGTVRFEATVSDSSGRGVSDAAVTVLTSMPALAMGSPMPMPGMGAAGESVRATSDGAGHYSANLRISRSTLWTFVVHARQGDKFATRVVQRQARP